MNKFMKVLLPVAVLAVSVVVTVIIVRTKPEVDTQPPALQLQKVRVLEIQKSPVNLVVKGQGNVIPRTETALVTQVSGQVVKVAEAFVSGGFFEKNDILIQIDPRDYNLAVTQAELQVAQAELRVQIEQQEARLARLEWGKLNDGEPPALVAREPQLKEAKAALEAAKAGLDKAKLNLERTQIKAPYAGRIRTKSVDVGQYVNVGMNVAGIYAIDFAEVRLPLPDQELAYIDIPLGFRKSGTIINGPEVALRADFGGAEHRWVGHIARLEGEIDPRTRMVNVVARFADPYGRNNSMGNILPLKVGMFVTAEIEGKQIDNIATIPRSLLRENNQVLVIDKDERLRFRQVEVFRLERDTAYISAGLENGELLCITPLLAVVDGMKVSVLQPEDPVENDMKDKETP